MIIVKLTWCIRLLLLFTFTKIMVLQQSFATCCFSIFPGIMEECCWGGSQGRNTSSSLLVCSFVLQRIQVQMDSIRFFPGWLSVEETIWKTWDIVFFKLLLLSYVMIEPSNGFILRIIINLYCIIVNLYSIIINLYSIIIFESHCRGF